ncbi:sodium/solute symporter [candidate division KSB1 bacterium]
MGIAGIDIFIVVLFLIGILFYGTFFRRFVKTSDDYFIAKKMLPWWAIGMSIVLADIGAVEYMGMAGGTYRFGLAQANFDWIGCIPAMLVAAIIFIPYYWKAGVYTVPEYLGRRYNVYVQSIEAFLWIAFLAFVLGIILWATALFLNTLMGWPHWVSIIVTAAIVGIYTVSGGLSAVVMTNALQMIILFIGAIAILILGFKTVGGWGEMSEKIFALGPEFKNHFKLLLPMDTTTPYPWAGIVFGAALVISPAYWIGNQAIIQASLGARNEWDAKAGVMWAAILKTLIPVLIAVPGLIALALYPGLSDGDTALPMLLKNLLPPGLTGLVFAAFFAALMSTVAAYLESAATLFTKDIYQKFIIKEAPDRHYLIVGRYLTVGIILFGMVIAPLSERFPGIFVMLQTIMSIFYGPTFAILLLGMLWKRPTQWGGFFGLICGVILSSFLFTFKSHFFNISEPFLYISWWSFIFAVVVNITVSLFTKPKSDDELDGLVYGLVVKDKSTKTEE